MATAVGTPVIGLHAASNPQRSGPYFSREWCVDRYDDAARQFLGKRSEQIKWGTKIERPGVMDLVTVDDVVNKLDALQEYQSRLPDGQGDMSGHNMDTLRSDNDRQEPGL
jgi:heptosyltransferase I